MALIGVCGVDDMRAVVASVGAGRLISLLPEEDQPRKPRAIKRQDHLRVLIDDITEPSPGFVMPAREHVDEIVRFLRASPPEVPLVIHCHAGVSRSTATALVALALDAPGREREAAALLREMAPFAFPNELIVQLADEALERRGALVAALESIGHPRTFAFKPFYLPRRLPVVHSRAR
jgi:predicted protein tyrosine phosphatase